MRENIGLYRGKRVDNGEWVYGYYTGPVGVACDHEICDIDDPTGSRVDVDPSTVGQYTGLTDRNGKRIFEGDVVEDIIGRKRVVEFCDGGYYPFIAFPELNCWSEDECEVIGNMHDNSELLEVRAE